MACKIRLHGTEEEVGKILFTLEEDKKYKILSQSKVYEDRGNSEYIRIYLDVEIKN